VDRHDRGVIEARLDAGLAQEARDVLVGRLRGVQALDRDVAADAAVVRGEDLAGAAAAARDATVRASSTVKRERARRTSRSSPSSHSMTR